MKVFTDTPEGSTVIQNSFIDQYMPCAPGEYVKVYLYLLRCANLGREISVSLVADVFDQTEKDVLRALSYWEKQELIRVRVDEDGELVSLVFTDPGGYVPLQNLQENPGKKKEDVPAGIPELADDEREELSLLYAVAEQYLGRPLSTEEMKDFVYYYSTLGFSSDLIEYLLEYCVMRGATGRHYMRAVALGWAKSGITTVSEAKKESSLYNKNYYTIMKALGLKRDPALSEQETMSRWLDEYRFSMDLILEACKRSIAQTHQPSFQYADKILRDWHESGVQSMQDVETLDEQWAQKHSAARESQKRAVRGKDSSFNQFPQREYDYKDLGKKLFGQK